jgi:pyrroline-5-carboxylate reductase
MSAPNQKIGIIGGSGILGRAISHALLSKQVVSEENYWISNRSGNRTGFDAWSNTHITDNNQSLNEACDVIILCVPPDQFQSLTLNCKGKLVISVMAGVSIEKLQKSTGSNRVVRAMCSPAAELFLAYSPWVASEDITQDDRVVVSQLLNACGETDELNVESQIEIFTAITGPVPGFVSFFADCVAKFAIDSGVNIDVANRAVKQLFLGAGTMMANGDTTPNQDVQEIIAYNGTTTAGVRNMQASSISDDISAGLQAAVEKTRLMS